jgi:hypothetical protein
MVFHVPWGLYDINTSSKAPNLTIYFLNSRHQLSKQEQEKHKKIKNVHNNEGGEFESHQLPLIYYNGEGKSL